MAKIDPQQLVCALGSPLRLRLVAELLEASDGQLSLDEAIVKTGRHIQDGEACIRPMVRWGVLEELGEQRLLRFRKDLSVELRETIEQVVEQQAGQLGRERHVLDVLLGGMFGVDPKMQLIFEMIRQVARIDVPVLIQGETGTGKELVARSTHDMSPRRDEFFGAVSCATLPENLFESQIFGHVRGAFTGAVRDHVGLVERCDKGTLFLDEIGDMSMANQVKLLRVLQEGTFMRVGETSTRQSGFRLISATNRNLPSMVQEGTFREDLYYRLNVFPIRIPSLRERLGDLPYLVDGILSIHARRFRNEDDYLSITAEAIERLCQHHWPGNIRELENVIIRAAIMAGTQPITVDHLPAFNGLLVEDTGHGTNGVESPSTRMVKPEHKRQVVPLSSVEREHIAFVLRAKDWNVRAASKALGICRTTLYKKIKLYGIKLPG